MKTHKIDRQSWTYWILSFIYDSERTMPKSRCGYTWTFIFSLVTVPIWILTAKNDGINSLPARIFIGTVMWIIVILILMVVLGVGTAMFVYPFGDLSMFAEPVGVIIMAWIGYTAILVGIVTTIIQHYDWMKYYHNWQEKRELRRLLSTSDEKETTSLWTKVCKPIEYTGKHREEE